MGFILQRFGFRVSRGAAITVLVIGALVGAAFWVGPLRPLPPELELMVLDGGSFGLDLDLRGDTAVENARFPLILAAHNRGPVAGTPASLELSVPSRFRLRDRFGRPLPRTVETGIPLARYSMPLRVGRLAPGSVPEVILDTILLDARVPDFTCIVQPDGIPEFIPAEPLDPRLLANVDIFYSFTGADYTARQTGVLRLQLDPTQVEMEPVVVGEPGEVTLTEPQAEAPVLTALSDGGSADVECGDAERPVNLHTAVWNTAERGRFIVVYHDGAPRKHLYDLNRDSIVELEMWDPDADGDFEAARTVRYPIPAFLLPGAPFSEIRIAADTVPPDSAFLAMFANIAAGPFRFARGPQPADTMVADSLRPDSLRSDSLRAGVLAADSAAAPDSAAATRPVTPAPARVAVDSAFVRLFNNVAAGPFRFTPGGRTPRSPQLARPVPEPEPEPEPAEPDDGLLGTPIDWPPPPPPDTSSRN